MFSRSKTELTPPFPAPPGRWRGLRVTAVALLGAAALAGVLLLAYELAVARVPQHRAALEELVRAQTGLDVRFNELGLRWGWYGPEAVFHRVELGEPGRSNVLLTAPELVVGFDVWRTVRSGRLEAGRITLVTPDIDFERVGPGVRTAAALGPAAAARSTAALRAAGARGAGNSEGARILQRWRGGRIDIEGGTLRLPDPAGSATPFTLQIRHASLRRSTSEWSAYGLVFLPDRLGRTARIVMRLDGDLQNPAGLGGTLRFEGHRLLFSGWREMLGSAPEVARYLPRAGGGDLELNVDFDKGHVVKADGKVRVGGLEFDSPQRAAAGSGVLALDRLRGEWRLARRDSNWRLRVDSLDVGTDPQSAGRQSLATLTLDAGPGAGWVRGKLEYAPLPAVAAVARWLAPHLDLAGFELGGTARDITFDWNDLRPAGERLQSSARLDAVALAPPSHAFSLSGLSARVSGGEDELIANVAAEDATLQLAQAPRQPLREVQVVSQLRILRTDEGWRVATDDLQIQHERARLSVSGALTGNHSGSPPRILAHGVLAGADVPYLQKLLGENTVAGLDSGASRLSAGRIERAEFELRGPLDEELALRTDDAGFSGSLTLREASLSGAPLWPDVAGLEGRIEWHGSRLRALLEKGHAGSFQLDSAKAEWDALGGRAAHISGRVAGHVEEALAWVRSHPRLQQYSSRVQNIELRGDVAVDFNLTVAPAGEGQAPNIQGRVAALLDGAHLQPVAGVPSIEAVRGTLAFNTGHVERSTLTGTWLGGPVILRIGERRERGATVLAVQARGVLDARQLGVVGPLGAVGGAGNNVTLDGSTEWSAELAYLAATESQPAQWRVKADSSLIGIASGLPEPLRKSGSTALPLHIDVQGGADSAELRLSLGERLRGLFALNGRDGEIWAVERGRVHFGTSAPTLPDEPVVSVEGRVSQLDLPAYVAAWRQLRREQTAPPLRAELVAVQMMAAGRSYPEVTVLANPTDLGEELQLESADMSGVARWPATDMSGAARWPSTGGSSRPVELHFTRLSVPEAAHAQSELDVTGLVGALAPAADVSVDELVWSGRPVGRFAATVAARLGGALDIDELRLTGSTHDLRGAMHCQGASCRLKFMLDSSNAAATLEDFGFRPDLVAADASLSGDLQWELRGEEAPLASLNGRLSMRLEDGVTRAAPAPRSAAGQERMASADGRVVMSDAAGRAPVFEAAARAAASDETVRAGGPDGSAGAGVSDSRPFALLSVPALVSGMVQYAAQDAAGAAQPVASAQLSERRELRFSRLEADFELHDGVASTSNLHFDGDAEILMRGRTGLVARDYDQQVWILRGEERLPAAVRRLGPTPRVAAVWLSLRDLFAGAGVDRSRAVLRLQGSWDDPIVVAAQ